MRKRVVGKKLNRSRGHRKSMSRNLLQALYTHGKVKTTLTKAKYIRPRAEKLITKAGEDTDAARKVAHKWLYEEEIIEKLFNEIAPRYKKHPGGYTRIVKLGARQGDATEEAIIELIEVPTASKKDTASSNEDETDNE